MMGKTLQTPPSQSVHRWESALLFSSRFASKESRCLHCCGLPGKTLSVSEACSYLSEVGLCARDYIHREVNASLSGGELKRIEIATVMARHSRLTVFDEPEAGIDLWSFQNLIRIFESMRSNIQDSAMIIISHQERILKIADEIAVLAEGRLERCGPRDEMLPALIGTESAQDACSRLK